MKNVHTSWCSHSIEDKNKSYDITQTYALLNHTKCQVKGDMKKILHQLIHFMEDLVC